jgi:putative transposase
VDTLGLVHAVAVHGTDVQDRDGGDEVLLKIAELFHRLKRIWADGGCAGQFVEEANIFFGRVIEIVKRSDDAKEFKALTKRWIVESTFSWLGRYRRLGKDYESDPRSSEAMIHLAMINLMVHRLAPG